MENKAIAFTFISLFLISLAFANYTVSFSPDNFSFFPNETRDYTVKLVNNDHAFNATVTIKSLDTTLFLVNNSQSVNIEIVNWGVGDAFNIPINITTAVSANFSDSANLKINIYDEDNDSDVYTSYKEVSIVTPTGLTYSLNASLSDVSTLTIIVLFNDDRNSTEMNDALVKDLFDSWANVTANEELIASGTSDNLTCKLDLIGKIGKAELNYGVNYSTGSLNEKASIELAYELQLNATATYLGDINYYYPLTEPVKSGTLICVEGNVTYDGVFPLGYFGEDYTLNMTVKNNVTTTYELTPDNYGKFKKCFKASNETGNYTITIEAIGVNNLKANWSHDFKVSNIKEYKPEENVITPEVAVSLSGDNLTLENKKSIYLFGWLTLNEDSEFKHLVIGNNKTYISLEPNGKVTIKLNISAVEGCPPGTYKINGKLETALGTIPFSISYNVAPETESIGCKRYWEKSENKTRIILYAANPTDSKVSMLIRDEIPKSVVSNLSFLEPDQDNEQRAKNCEDETCVIDIAKSTKDCGVCESQKCWEECINAYLQSPGNKTYPIIFMQKPTVIKNDPVVAWNITLDPNSAYKITYIIENSTNPMEFPEPMVDYSEIKTITPAVNQTNETNQSQSEETNQSLIVYEKENDLLMPSITAAIIVALGLGIVFYIKFRKKIEKELEKREGGSVETLTKLVKPEEPKEEKEIIKEVKKEKKPKKKEKSPEEGLDAIGGTFFR